MIRFKEKKKELTIDEYNKFISLINSYDSNIKALDHKYGFIKTILFES